MKLTYKFYSLVSQRNVPVFVFHFFGKYSLSYTDIVIPKPYGTALFAVQHRSTHE